MKRTLVLLVLAALPRFEDKVVDVPRPHDLDQVPHRVLAGPFYRPSRDVKPVHAEPHELSGTHHGKATFADRIAVPTPVEPLHPPRKRPSQSITDLFLLLGSNRDSSEEVDACAIASGTERLVYERADLHAATPTGPAGSRMRGA